MPETAFSILTRELCVVAREAGAHDIPVIIGGGMGLLLKDEVIRKGRFDTLRSYPPVRTTSDLDLFLDTEIIADHQNGETEGGP